MKNRWVRGVCVFVFLCCLPLTGGQAQAAGGGAAPQVAPPGTTETLSIPAAAFLPMLSGRNYENHGQYLYHLQDTTAATQFVAGVELPHGALINQVSFCFYDDSASKTVSATLYHRAFHHAGVEMATGSSAGLDSGFATLNLTNITDALVDNVNSIYFIQALLPVTSQAAGDDLRLCGATIRYNRPAQVSGVLAIPAASLTPMSNGYSAHRTDGMLEDHSPLGGYYLGAVHLPDGAQVTKLTLRYKDALDTNMAMLNLIARDSASDGHIMASVTSVDSSTEEQRSDTTIDASYALIANQSRAYYVQLFVPKTSEIQGVDYLWVTAILIEYTAPGWSRDQILHIPPAAFRSFHDSVAFDSGNWLMHLASEGGGSLGEPYVAPVYLPQGAKITYANFKFYDGSNTADGTAVLVRVRWGAPVTLAERTTSGAPGNVEGMLPVNTAYEIVDNSLYAYYVYYYLPVSTAGTPATGDVAGNGVRVYYQQVVCAYLPIVRMAK